MPPGATVQGASKPLFFEIQLRLDQAPVHRTGVFVEFPAGDELFTTMTASRLIALDQLFTGKEYGIATSGATEFVPGHDDLLWRMRAIIRAGLAAGADGCVRRVQPPLQSSRTKVTFMSTR